MRTLKLAFFCIATFLAIAQVVHAASYTVSTLSSDFKFRNNNGARLSVPESFAARSPDDWDLHSTLTVTDPSGGVISQYTSPNHTKDVAEAFSDNGIIAGTRGYYILGKDIDFFPFLTFTHAFVFANGGFTDLNELLDAAFGTGTAGRVYRSAAHGVNKAGDVVGDFSTSAGQFGFLYHNSAVVNLGPVTGPTITTALAINNFGQVTGTNGDAFIYSNGASKDLGFLNNASRPQSVGVDINDAGQVIGISGEFFDPRAFLYQGGTMIGLGTLGQSNSEARAINNAGVVVGVAHGNDGPHPFIYRDGQMTDLATLLDSSTYSGIIYDAIGINDDGVIVVRSAGSSSNNLLLTPTQAAASDSAVFNFEGGTQGWVSSGQSIIGVTTSNAQKFAGEKSLAIALNDAGFASVQVLNPSAHAGQTLTFHVYIPADAHIDWVQPFAQEDASGNWNWHGNWTSNQGLQPGAWNTITVDVPASASALNAIGLELSISEAGGTVYLDSVDYGSTADTAQYNFEADTQSWASSDSSASVSTSTAQKFAGESSLAITPNNVTFATADVRNPAAHAGQTITFHIYLPAAAPITSVQPYAQEGAAGNWAWHGTWTSIYGLQLGAWNTITVNLPSNAQPLMAIGLQVSTSQPYAGTIYLDNVSF